MNETLKEKLDNASTEAMKAAEELCKALGAIGAIEYDAPKTKEEAEAFPNFLIERDRRCAYILRRVLVEYGNFLFL